MEVSGQRHAPAALYADERSPGSEAHPASGTVGTGGPFPGAKPRPGRDADQSPSSSAEVKNK
jgi:hypothetical protein